MCRSGFTLTVVLSLALPSLPLALPLCLTACGGRSFGGAPDDGGVGLDGASPDASVGLGDYSGYVSVTHVRQGGAYTSENVALNAVFYDVVWEFYRVHPWHMSSGMTPDGVVCDAFVSDFADPPPPEPPPQVDGGDIYAWAGFDGDGQLEITFDGESYYGDFRSRFLPGGEPWPPWLVDDAMALQVESTGSLWAPPFYTEVFLAQMPEILSPLPGLDEPITPDPDGNHRISWSSVESDFMEVSLQLHNAMSDVYFGCYPPAGQNDLLVPHAWLDQWTPGSWDLMVSAVNNNSVVAGDGVVTVRTFRTQQQSVNIADLQ